MRRRQLVEPPYLLDECRRGIVLRAILETCRCFAWEPLAVHVRSNHFHAIVESNADGKGVVNSFKRYASRDIRRAGLDLQRKRFWTQGGSCRYLWWDTSVDAAADYVLFGQGEPMEFYPDGAAL